MAFKTKQTASGTSDTPEGLVGDLRTKKIPGLLSHQADVLREYHADALEAPDVAIQLPTGSGKTLVGLVLAEWRQRRFGERVVYLCPTNQLVYQVVEQASARYGITPTAFTGRRADYGQAEKAAYLNAETVAVTSYSSLFNSNPFFEDPHVIVLDDSHAAEQYIASQWSLLVDRGSQEHRPLYDALVAFLRPVLSPLDYRKLVATGDDRWDDSWVDTVPLPALMPLHSELASLLDEYTAGLKLKHAWGILRDHLAACHLYVSARGILLRPLIPPTETHTPFAGATQRIYMSATLGEGGDLERLTGRSKITRLSVPQGWERQGIGRRLFLFPETSLGEDESRALAARLIERAGRALVIAPSDSSAGELRGWAASELEVPVFDARQIERSKRVFTVEPRAVAVVANRYDGIDFPEDECRLLFIEGLPRTVNLQERFLVARMGAVALLTDRIRTRIVQAFGRCTRSSTDFAAVVVGGDALSTYLMKREHRAVLHPELQAELEFGLDGSRNVSLDEFAENFDLFLQQGAAWGEAHKDILERRASLNQSALPGVKDLGEAVVHEVTYQHELWRGHFEAALEAARKVLTKLTDPHLKGYRALWHYLAGNAAWLAAEDGIERLRGAAREHYASAAAATHALRWMATLARPDGTSAGESLTGAAGFGLALIERLEAELERLGTANDRRFDAIEREILDGINGSEPRAFEQAHAQLGQLLGYEAGNRNTQGAPDPWWMADDRWCAVFEDHSDAAAGSALSIKKARQAATHPNWVRAELPVEADAIIVPILVSAVTALMEGASPHLAEVRHWPLEGFRSWAREALATVRELRRTFHGSGDLAWRSEALEAYRRHGLDRAGLLAAAEQRASDLPVRRGTLAAEPAGAAE